MQWIAALLLLVIPQQAQTKERREFVLPAGQDAVVTWILENPGRLAKALDVKMVGREGDRVTYQKLPPFEQYTAVVREKLLPKDSVGVVAFTSTLVNSPDGALSEYDQSINLIPDGGKTKVVVTLAVGLAVDVPEDQFITVVQGMAFAIEDTLTAAFPKKGR